MWRGGGGGTRRPKKRKTHPSHPSLGLPETELFGGNRERGTYTGPTGTTVSRTWRRNTKPPNTSNFGTVVCRSGDPSRPGVGGRLKGRAKVVTINSPSNPNHTSARHLWRNVEDNRDVKIFTFLQVLFGERPGSYTRDTPHYHRSHPFRDGGGSRR